MLSYIAYTVFWILCIFLVVVSIISLFQFLRKLTEKEAKEKDWFRYVAPTVLALILSGLFKAKIGKGGFFEWGWTLFIAIGLPFGLAFFLLRDQLEKKNERLAVIAALLFLLNAAAYTLMWCHHYRTTHAAPTDDDYAEEQDEGDNPHVTVRNYFLIPMWVITIILAGHAGFLHHKNRDQRESTDSSYLPF